MPAPKTTQLAGLISLILLNATLAASAQAQSQLDTVVVSAAGFEQDVKAAPASITVVTREQLEKNEFLILPMR